MGRRDLEASRSQCIERAVCRAAPGAGGPARPAGEARGRWMAESAASRAALLLLAGAATAR